HRPFDRRYPLRKDRQSPQSYRGGRRARNAAHRSRGIPAENSVAHRARRHPWPPHTFSGAAAEVALFDPEAWALTAREAAREAAADGVNMTFAPMLDVSREPRWGRTIEGPGESPWVGRQLAEAKVRGFQGSDLAAADS